MAGSKMTLQDVADLANVSKWTASRAFTPGASISPAAKERVLAAAKTLGYRKNLLAQSLSTNKTNLVGLVVDELANPYLFSVLDKLMTLLQRQGQLCIVLNISAHESYRKHIELVEQFQVDALLFIGTSITPDIVELTQTFSDMPFVVLFRESLSQSIPFITTRDFEASAELANLLVEEGYKDFDYLAGPTNETTALRRLAGYRQGLSEQGYSISSVIEGEHYCRDEAYKRVLTHYQANRPKGYRALFCENDILAVGAIDALRALNLTHQVGVVGFDNITLANATSYDLTTVEQPLDDILSAALAYIKNPAQARQQQYVSGKLIVRRSHKCSKP